MTGKEDTPKPQVAAESRIMRFAPGLRTIRSYRKEDLRSDLLAGLVICLVLVPSALAYAELAGFGPLAGIYSAIAATLAYFLFTSSRHMNVGPDGAVALLVGTAILPLTDGDPAKAVVAGTWLAVFTGLILILAARFKLGVICAVLPLGWLGAHCGPRATDNIPTAFPVHIQALIGTWAVSWLFRLVGLLWLVQVLLHAWHRFGAP